MTTAAIGLAVRAAGAGLRVFFGQFVKGQACSEVAALGRFSDLIPVRLFGRECFIRKASERVELVLTGHHAVPAVVHRSDVLTNMEEVKHYYRRGILAREGIEC